MYTAMNHELENENCKIGKKEKKEKKRKEIELNPVRVKVVGVK